MTQLWNPSPIRRVSPDSETRFASDGDEWAIASKIHSRLISQLDDAALHATDMNRLREEIEVAARQVASQMFPALSGDQKEEVISIVVDEVAGLGPIEALLRDPDVSEVMVNGAREVYFERAGLIERAPIEFQDDAHVHKIIDRIVSAVGRHVDEASPMVDARLADGSRVNVVIPPLVPQGPVITIRRFRTDRFTMDDLATIGSLTPEMAAFLDACVRARLSIVISGGTGSGKTTALNALSASIPDGERIITIEDPIELRLLQRHVIAMEARPSSTEGRGEVTQRALLRNALRMRPDRILVGEVRGGEAFDMLQAMNTGHDGSLTTVHANSPRDALSRIENMVLTAGFDLPVSVIRDQMASAFDVVVQISRMADGTRKIVRITEVTGSEGDVISLQDLFQFTQTGIDSTGRVLGAHQPTGIRPTFADRLKAQGLDLDATLFNVERW
jgi:pilus assembly protein CpaF